MIGQDQYQQIFEPYEIAGNLIVTGRPQGYNAEIVQMTFDQAPAVGKKVFFDSNSTIKYIKGIKAITNLQISAITESGVTKNIPTADGYNDAILVLVDNQNNVCAKIPLYVLTTEANKGKPVYIDAFVSWHNCYVQFTGNTAGISTNDIFLFNVWTN